MLQKQHTTLSFGKRSHVPLVYIHVLLRIYTSLYSWLAYANDAERRFSPALARKYTGESEKSERDALFNVFWSPICERLHHATAAAAAAADRASPARDRCAPFNVLARDCATFHNTAKTIHQGRGHFCRLEHLYKAHALYTWIRPGKLDRLSMRLSWRNLCGILNSEQCFFPYI